MEFAWDDFHWYVQCGKPNNELAMWGWYLQHFANHLWFYGNIGDGFIRLIIYWVYHMTFLWSNVFSMIWMRSAPFRDISHYVPTNLNNVLGKYGTWPCPNKFGTPHPQNNAWCPIQYIIMISIIIYLSVYLIISCLVLSCPILLIYI